MDLHNVESFILFYCALYFFWLHKQICIEKEDIVFYHFFFLLDKIHNFLVPRWHMTYYLVYYIIISLHTVVFCMLFQRQCLVQEVKKETDHRKKKHKCKDCFILFPISVVHLNSLKFNKHNLFFICTFLFR